MYLCMALHAVLKTLKHMEEHLEATRQDLTSRTFQPGGLVNCLYQL